MYSEVRRSGGVSMEIFVILAEEQWKTWCRCYTKILARRTSSDLIMRYLILILQFQNKTKYRRHSIFIYTFPKDTNSSNNCGGLMTSIADCGVLESSAAIWVCHCQFESATAVLRFRFNGQYFKFTGPLFS